MIRTTGILFGVVLLAQASGAFAQTSGEGPRNAIGYASVSEAYNALRAKPGVTFSDNAGWTIANDTDRSIWSFTPANHYAHPSVGRRSLVASADGYHVETRILCQADKAACDRLRDDYVLLDKRMTEAIRAGK
jgi:hypothetical protein